MNFYSSNNPNTSSKDYFSKLGNKEFNGHKKRVYTLDWNCTGTRLASGAADCNIRVNTFLSLDLEPG